MSCMEIADAGIHSSCELALLAIDAVVTELPLYLNPCGMPVNDPIPPQSPPACQSLDMCCGSIQNSNDSETCSFVQSLHFAGPCSNTLAYLKTKEECGNIDFDAGTWEGLAPVYQTRPDGAPSTSTGGGSESSH